MARGGQEDCECKSAPLSIAALSLKSTLCLVRPARAHGHLVRWKHSGLLLCLSLCELHDQMFSFASAKSRWPALSGYRSWTATYCLVINLLFCVASQNVVEGSSSRAVCLNPHLQLPPLLTSTWPPLEPTAPMTCTTGAEHNTAVHCA